MTTPRKIRWLIAHQPEELFVRTARAFSQELAQRCGDELQVEILTPPTYAEKYGEIPGIETLEYRDQDSLNQDGLSGFETGIAAYWKSFTDGAFEMSQMQVARVGQIHEDFKLFDLPYLFNDHDHVSRVVDGDIGREICEHMSKNTAIKGLAFTYSGGYRVIGSNNPIDSIEDLQKLKVVVENRITLGMAMEDLGIETVVLSPSLWKKHDPVGTGQADAVETTYLRFDGRCILKTNHSMFMTTILVTNAFWATLTEHQQQSFQEAARAAAAIERAWALEDAAEYEAKAKERGIRIVDISDEDAALLKRKSQMVYVKTNDRFTKGLVHRIKTA